MEPLIHLSFAPVGSGFSVLANSAAQQLLPNYPSHIAFWVFSKIADAKGFADRLSRMGGGLEIHDDRESSMFMTTCWTKQ